MTFEQRPRERARPPARHDLPLAHIRRDDELPGKGRGRAREPLRFLERAGAQDDPCSAFVEQTLDRVTAVHPATHLDRDGNFGEDLAHDGGVVTARSGGIEIDDVHALKSGACPTARDLERVVETHCLVRVGATHELHTRALAEIHSGDGDHCAASRRNARTRSTPAAELFSGWNCTPTVRSARTSAGKRVSPCELHACTQLSSLGWQT